MMRPIYRFTLALALGSALLILLVQSGWVEGRPENLRHTATGTLWMYLRETPTREHNIAETAWLSLIDSEPFKQRVRTKVARSHPDIKESDVEIQAVLLNEEGPHIESLWRGDDGAAHVQLGVSIPGTKGLRLRGISQAPTYCRVYVETLLDECLFLHMELAHPGLIQLTAEVQARYERYNRLQAAAVESPEMGSQRDFEAALDRAGKDLKQWRTLLNKENLETTLFNPRRIEYPYHTVKLGEGWNPFTLALRHPLPALLCVLVAGVVVMLLPFSGILKKGGTPSAE